MLQSIVVKKGETISSITEKYQTTTDSIVSLNKINPANSLVPGQTLVINTPGDKYTVQPGDTLYKLALTYNISIKELANANKLAQNAMLRVGQQLTIPSGKKRSIQSIGYLQPTSDPIKPALLDSTKNNAKYLTYLAPFSFEVKKDGTLKMPPIKPVLPIAKENGVIPMLVLTNIENGNFSPELANQILQSSAVQDLLITNILATAKKYEMTDIHFDFENLKATDRQPYNNFLKKMKSRLPSGYLLSTTVPPKTSSKQKGFYEAMDYKAQGEIVDFIVIMTYDWGWQGGPPFAISPIGPVKQVIQYAKTQIPANKIMLGQNLYGFDWILPFKQGNPPAKAVSAQSAVEIARKAGVPIEYNTTYEAPHFKYYDEKGVQHEVWFEDARSVQASFNLIKTEKLRGISDWKLGLPFPQKFLLLDNNFAIAKNRTASTSEDEVDTLSHLDS